MMAENPAKHTQEIIKPSRYDRIKNRVNTILNTYPNEERTARFVRYFLAIFILANTIAVVISTMPDLPHSFRAQLFAIISVCLTIFAIEYILRLWSCTNNPTFTGRVIDRLRYATSIYMIIDLISIIPIVFPFAFPKDYSMLHIFRLLSIFKLVRYTRHSDALQLMNRVFFKKREIISFLVIFLVFEILFSSTVMYLVENAAQPDKFSSIPAAMWWAAMTVTTVGYGDIVPITPLGKTIASMVTIGGVLLLALPSAILAAGFMEERQKEQTHNNHYGTEAGISLLERVGNLKERGLINEEEFEEYKTLILPRLRDHEEEGEDKK
ncbi:MAG: ion transporter [Methanoregula sp.]|nr:ion transporter [Methanoregula sp.]